MANPKLLEEAEDCPIDRVWIEDPPRRHDCCQQESSSTKKSTERTVDYAQCGYLEPQLPVNGYLYYPVIGGLIQALLRSILVTITNPINGIVTIPGDLITPWCFQLAPDGYGRHIGVIILPADSPLVRGEYRLVITLSSDCA
jgi:hypothetical protein